MKMLPLIFFFYLGLIFSPEYKPNPSITPYEEEIKIWHQKRIQALKAEDGWLNLAGLLWLKEGTNKVGSSLTNDIVLPAAGSDPYIGSLILALDKVNFIASTNSKVLSGGITVKELNVYPYEKPVVLAHRDLRWTIIKRGDQYGVRLRDLNHPNLKSFKGIETYPIDVNWKVQARFTPTLNRKIPITNILGQTTEQDVMGILEFVIKGRTYTLNALSGGENKLFLIFSDPTNEQDTYYSGRFLAVDYPDKEGKVWIDFNKAINPPCAFTSYATCPIPPKENRIDVPILAGEKRFGNH